MIYLKEQPQDWASIYLILIYSAACITDTVRAYIRSESQLLEVVVMLHTSVACHSMTFTNILETQDQYDTQGTEGQGRITRYATGAGLH